MPSFVLDGAFPHSVLFPSSPLFSLPPKILGVPTMFTISALALINFMLALLNVSFLVTLEPKRVHCYSPVLRR